MSTSSPQRAIYRFGAFELDARTRELRKSGLRIRCQEQPLQVLAALLARPGELLTREELRQMVWPEDTFVDFDHALTTAVKKIRLALNDDADSPRYLETVPRHGYRFIAPVQTEMTTPQPNEKRVTRDLDLPSGERPLINRRVIVMAASLIAGLGGLYYWSNHRARASALRPGERTWSRCFPLRT